MSDLSAPPPVFIVGCPRSGTTWLYHILLSAGRFAIYRSETQIYSAFAPRYGNFSSSCERTRFLRKWIQSEYFLRSGLSPESFYARAMKNGSSPGAMLRLFMEEICEYQQATRWAECTPENALYLDAIQRDFPDALFIHLVRDGRDVALSLSRQQFIRPFPWHRRSPELAAAAYWRWIVNHVDNARSALRDRLLTVKYEDLVTDYDGSLDRLSSFVGQRIEVQRVSEASIGSVATPNSSFAHNRADSFVGRWRTLYEPFKLRAVEQIIGDTLALHGYERDAATATSVGATQGTLYSLKFRLSFLAKTRTFLGRLSDDRLDSLPVSGHGEDPTLRPREHPNEIRRLVGR